MLMNTKLIHGLIMSWFCFTTIIFAEGGFTKSRKPRHANARREKTGNHSADCMAVSPRLIRNVANLQQHIVRVFEECVQGDKEGILAKATPEEHEELQRVFSMSQKAMEQASTALEKANKAIESITRAHSHT